MLQLSVALCHGSETFGRFLVELCLHAIRVRGTSAEALTLGGPGSEAHSICGDWLFGNADIHPAVRVHNADFAVVGHQSAVGGVFG